MKKSLLLSVFLFIGLTSFAQSRFWVSAIASNWNNTNNWSTTSNGAPGASVPGAGNLAVFNGAGSKNGNCFLDLAPTVGGITMTGYTGTLDLFGSTLTTTGTNSLTTGTISNSLTAASVAINNASLTTTFGGTTFGTNVSVTGTSGNIFFNGSTFAGAVNLTKANTGNDNGTGNNTFNGAVTLTNTSTAILTLGNTNKDIFNSTLTININNTGTIAIANGGATAHQLNDNVSINYNSTGNVTFGNGAGPSTLASGKTITVASFGAAGCGNLLLRAFTASTTAQNIVLGGNTTATLTIGPLSTFAGPITVSSPGILLTSSNFNGATSFTKTGSAVDNSVGGNTYTSLNLFNTGAGDFVLANTSPDTFNGNTILNNTGTGRVQVALSSVGNVFNGNLTINHGGNTNGINCILARNSGSTIAINGNLTLNQTNLDPGSGTIIGNDGAVTINGNVTMSSTAGRGILFGGDQTTNLGSVTLGNGFTMKDAGAGTYTTGLLQIYRTTQVGSTAQAFALTGTSQLVIGVGTTFNANVNFVSPQVNLNGATYNGTTLIEKNGATDNNSSGNNTFNGTTTITDSGSGYLLMANNNPDTFGGDVTFTNTGTNWIFVAHNVNGTVFNGNITVNNTTGNGVIFSNNSTGSSSQASGKTISVGATGFPIGELRIKRFTQNGTAPTTLNLTGTAAIRFGPGTTFGGNFITNSPQVFMDGATFNGTAFIQKTGATDNQGAGGNIFNSTSTIAMSGSGYILTANTTPDTFNDDLTCTNTGANIIYLAYNSPGTVFNGNIIVNSVGGSGVIFSNGGSGTSSLASGKTVSVGGLGFSSGLLRFFRFTQNGATPLNLVLTGTGGFLGGTGSVFNGNVNVVAPQMYLYGATYNGTAYLEKNGAVDNPGNGGNTFNAVSTIVNSGSGYLLTGNTLPDVFNADVNITNTGSNAIYMAYTTPNTLFNGNIFVNETSGAGIYFSNNATGSSKLAAGKTISVGASGYTAGQLRLFRMTQAGSAPVTLNLTNSASVQLGPGTTFGGNVNVVAPQLFLNGAKYNGTAYIEKTGAGDNAGNGGNTFSSTTTIVDSGSGYLMTANTSPDTFNGDLTLTNSGSNLIRIADNVPGTLFNGNIIVNCTSGGGISFSNNTTGTSEQTAGNTISIGGLGFSVGTLALKRFKQDGPSPVNLTLTGVATLRVGPSSSFVSDVTFVSPQVYLDGATYGGTSYVEKNGPTDNQSAGGNTFNGPTTFVESSSGYFLTGATFPDIYNGDLTLTNSGSNVLYMAWNSVGNQFNGNIIVNSTSGNGIYFSSAAGTSIMADTKTISVGGLGFVSGELRLYRFTQVGTSTPQALTLGGATTLRVGPTSTFNSNVNFVAPQLYLDGCTYNGVTYLEKNGAGNSQGNGGNTFNAAATIVNSGSGVLRTNGSNDFEGATSIINSGSNDLLLELVTGSIYNGDVTFTNTGSSYVRAAYTGTNTFNGNIIVNTNNGVGVYFCENTAGTATLANTKTITVGATGFSTGELRIQRFTQVGPTAQTLALTGNATLRLAPVSTFNGNVNFVAPQVYLDGTTYNGTAYIEKNGATGNNGVGANTFNAAATIVNSGSNFFRTNGGNVFNGPTIMTASGSGDVLFELNSGSTYNGDLTINNTGTVNVRMAYFGTSAFNGNIVVNSTSGTGIFFCENVATATLATGKTITTGVSGFSSGQLILQRFTQVGPTSQVLTLTNGSVLVLGSSSTFNGNVNFKAPQVYLNGCTYNGITLIEKTGAVDNDSQGNNIFNGVTTLTNSGSGFLRTARVAVDQFNNNLTLTNTGTYGIYMSDLAIGSVYGGNITVNCTLGTGIFFGNSNGSSTLANGKTISIGGSGFSFGELRLQNFTQTGGTAQTIALTGNADIRVGPASSFGGNVDFRAAQVYLDGANYAGTTYIEKNGAGNNTGIGNNTFGGTTTLVNSLSGQFRTNGNNTFNGTTTILNSGTNDILLEGAAGSTYNGNVTMSNTGSSYIRTAFTGTNFFNGNIVVNSLNATGVFFCENAAGTATLATGKTISVGGIGFTAGELRIQRFTQLGTTAQSLTLTAAAIFRTLNSTWNGGVTVSTPIIFLDGATFNGATNAFTKTGTSTDGSVGGNVFNGNATFTNSGTGIFRLATTTGDAYNGNATFAQPSGTVQPAYGVVSTASGDITTTSAAPMIFGSGGGTLSFTGGVNETINKAGAASPTFIRLAMNKTAGTVSLNTDILISNTATFTTGVMVTTGSNYINFAAGTTAAAASNASYVDGPVRKTGNNAFIFPVGNAGIYRAIAMSNPSVATDAFTAQYFKAAQAFGNKTTYAPTIFTLSACEYWILNRTVGTSNVNVTLSWNSPDCAGPYITDPTKLKVARWNLTQWVDHGNGGTTGNATTGTIVTAAPVTSFSPFTIASSSIVNPLPVELTTFTAEPFERTVQLNWTTASELNNDYFDVQRSADGVEFHSLAKVKGAGTTSTENHYGYLDGEPGSDKLYYRLRQSDFDGKSTYSKVVQVQLGEITSLVAYPNPVSQTKSVTLNYNGYYQVYSMMGVQVGKTEKTNTITTNGLTAGVYLIKADNGMILRLIVE